MAAAPDPVSPGAAQTWKLLTVARIKPLGEGATASVIKADDSSVVVHRDPTEVADDDEEDAPGGTAAFVLDKVCGPEAPQEEVYGLLKPVVTGASPLSLLPSVDRLQQLPIVTVYPLSSRHAPRQL